LIDDRLNLARLQTALGRDTRLADITASGIADYKVARMQTMIMRDGVLRSIAPATLNRELASLRHLLRLAHEEWEVLPAVPKIAHFGHRDHPDRPIVINEIGRS
jgi:hypothetical protein